MVAAAQGLKEGGARLGRRCFIAGAGDFCGLEPPTQGDYIIAADGGYARLDALGIVPDLVIGDFDSLANAPDHPNIVRTPAAKDDSDVGLAVKAGLAQGCKNFIIDGGLGGRLDHTLANIQILIHLASQGARGFLVGCGASVTAITNSALQLESRTSGYVSIFSAGGNAIGVTIEGLKYPLRDAVLTCRHPLGLSNEFIGKPATVSVRDGTLIVVIAA
jgi:thiamine pyrophosphokinase